MNTVFFVYTIALLVICVLAASTSLSAYFASHGVLYAFAVALFLFYLFDLVLIFQDEYLVQNLAFDESTFYSIPNPFFKTVMGGGYLMSIWLIVCGFLDRKSIPLKWIPLAVFLLLGCLVLWLVPTGKLQQYLFYADRSLFLVFIMLFVSIRYLRSDDKVERARMRRHLLLFAITGVLVITAAAEDIYSILIADPDSFTPQFPLYLSERNFSENLMLLVFAFCAFQASKQTLSLRFEKPPAREDDSIQMHIDEMLPVYCKRNGLSEREGEIVRMILLGKDNQNIANTFQLSLGTVKAHVNHILKKTGQTTRKDIVKDFWKL